MSKYLGQHFLKNKTAINKIIAALELQDGDTIIEIGPGRGALTMPLATRCQMLDVRCRIIGIEKDQALAKELARKLVISNLRLEIGDALKVLPKLFTNCQLPVTNYKIVGNIPYYITGKLLRVLGELPQKPQLIVLTVQREVAERITAGAGEMNPVRGREGSQRAPASNGMNLLAAAVQFWAEPKILFTLKPQDFDPPPEVQSSVIKLIPRDITRYSLPITQSYYSLIKIIFKQPRKTLVNNLTAGLKTSARGGSPPDARLPYGQGRAGVLGGKKKDILMTLKRIGLSPQARPQDLSVEKIISLLSLL